MTWWLRVHLVPAACAGVLACLVLAPLLAGSALPVPSLLGGLGTGIPVPLVLPAVPAGFLLYALSRGPFEHEATAVRPVRGYRAGLYAGAAVVAAALGLAEAQWLDFDLGPAVARNLVGYLGVGLIVQSLAGAAYGPVAVAAVPVGCALVGLPAGGRPYPWTWPLHEGPSPSASAAALGLFAVGLLLRRRARGAHT
ncbi:hypothetical protein ACH41E_34180 [Streptomyces sp. NPDC020412]|uniref:hypothetical protein n=1 Tax=Streptomyces sp. NPDC020412 TaxID=3365073 RepID=UPI0037AAA9E6